MAPRRFTILDSHTIWGQMPCWEIKEFGSISEYFDAYKAEEDEIVDEMARLENERFVELPEDYEVRA